MTKSFFIFILAILPVCASAQEEDGFIADRPGATTGVEVLPKGRVQLETGVGFERSTIDGPSITTWMLNNSLIRWGISESAELRMQADYLYRNREGVRTSSFSNVAIGTKVKLFKGWKAVPAISLLGNVLVPGSSISEFLPREWGGQMGLLFQNELTSWCSLGYETDLVWSDGAKPTFFWGICLVFQLNEHFSLMAEEYNNRLSDGHESWVELGAAYMLTPRLQLDIATDISLNYPNRSLDLMVGISWQISKK